MSNQRISERTPINRRGKIIQSDGTAVEVSACDISLHGVCFICKYSCDVDKEFDIVVALSGDPISGLIKAKAKTCYVNLVGSMDKFRIGMRFTSFKHSSQDILNDYIQKKMSKPKFIAI